MNTKIKIACVGCGFMGSALMKALAKKLPPKNIFLYDVDLSKAQGLAERIGGTAVKNAQDILAYNCDFLFLAVKPSQMKEAVQNLFSTKTILGEASGKQSLVSIAAGLSLQTISSFLPKELQVGAKNQITLIRLMPNLPVLTGDGMIALSASSFSDAKTLAVLTELLLPAGKVEQIPESLMDGIGAISGSGPAYAFVFIEALADAAVKFGIPRKQAYVYAAQTLKGAAAMVLETGTHPAELKDAVCSPAGTTIEAIETLEAAGFRSAIIQAATAAWEKSIIMGKS